MTLTALVLLLSTVSQSGEAPAVKVPLHEHPTLLAMLRRNNELRRGVGLKPQRINALLTQAAQNHARYMARTGGFSHYSNGGPWGRARRFGFFGSVRENIAMGHRNVANAFVGWRNSSGHWASITSNTSDVGFGYAISKGGTPYWVAVYGASPAKNQGAPAVADADGSKAVDEPSESRQPATTANRGTTSQRGFARRRFFFRPFRR